jgi:SpoVK/Ycf46/Vps4 family AAA+-type ATPase
MPSTEKLKRLFQAYKDYDDVAFLRAAQAIIQDALTSNRISEANELKKALGEGNRPLTPRPKEQFSQLPTSSRGEGKLLNVTESNVERSDLVLSEATRTKIERIVQEQKSKTLLHNHGLKAKSKLLFWGPPGCGKTFTSRYLAHELGLPIAVVQIGAVVSSYLGDTASHVKKIFDYVDANPVVLLLDEFDAIGKSRTDRQDVGEIRRTVNALLQALDNISGDRSLVIAASNYQDVLDEALWRRFDEVIEFPKPAKLERQEYVTHLLAEIEFEGPIAEVTRQTNLLSFAEIEKVVNETIKTALISGNSSISLKDLGKHLAKYKLDLRLAQRSVVRKRNG